MGRDERSRWTMYTVLGDAVEAEADLAAGEYYLGILPGNVMACLRAVALAWRVVRWAAVG